MSTFFSSRHKALSPYTPGEQPKERRFIKLNTNESPYPPTQSVVDAATAEAGKLQLYSDPTAAPLIRALANRYGVGEDQVIATNGSDEVLAFAFLAFGDEEHPFAFPDITYGFYPVFAKLYHVPFAEIPLRADFTIDVDAYCASEANIVIANPNAPTGIALPLSDVERIVSSNPRRVVIVDEAYVDFGAESAVSLVDRYPNLLVTGTFSKSRSLAGGRLGFGIASPSLIADLKTIQYSTNPYNVNRMTMAAGVAALENDAYYMDNCQKIIATREKTAAALEALGFFVLPSQANFLFVRSDKIAGAAYYEALRERGILVRHFTLDRIADYNRITIGTEEEMEALVAATEAILKEKQP